MTCISLRSALSHAFGLTTRATNNISSSLTQSTFRSTRHQRPAIANSTASFSTSSNKAAKKSAKVQVDKRISKFHSVQVKMNLSFISQFLSRCYEMLILLFTYSSNPIPSPSSNNTYSSSITFLTQQITSTLDNSPCMEPASHESEKGAGDGIRKAVQCYVGSERGIEVRRGRWR